jgi:D-glycero-alpha-D-manno-heptose-7-phosphate kinase
MIIVRTPYRISLFGGGTDFPSWYKKNQGMVIAGSINHYSYIILKKLPEIFKYNYRIRYYKREEVKKISEIKHPVVRELIKLSNVKSNLDITHHGDLPARSGIGSSSSFTVGLIHALETFCEKMPNKRQLALNAINLEQNILCENVGSQDQITASFGGFNKIKFGGPQEFICENIPINDEKIKTLEDWSIMIYTNKIRLSEIIETEKIKNLNKNYDLNNKILDITKEAEKILLSNKSKWIVEVGKLLDEYWSIKKKLSKNISNDFFDNIYQIGKKNGAIGGKLLGAGGGGFMLFIAPPNKHGLILNKLKKFPLIKFRFEMLGSQVIHKSY